MLQFLYKSIYSPFNNKILRKINKFLLPILPKKIKIPPSGIISLNTNNKRLKLKTNQTNYLTHLLFWEGYENFEYSTIFIKLIKKVAIFYDIGANIGYYSLLAATHNKDLKITAFEPASGPLFYLKENIKLNDFHNIQVEDIALSEKKGEITFYEVKNKKYTYLKHNLAGESNAGSKTTGRNFVPSLVNTVTLNDYVNNRKHDMIDLIKMDTEGTEHLILAQASVILGEMKSIIICETLFSTIESELEQLFKSFGYEFYNHTGNSLKKVDSIERKHDNGIRNCFFVHPSKFYLIKEFV